MQERHPNDYTLCIASIETVIATPDYIGQAPHHRDNFELVKYVSDMVVLVAVSAIPDEHGDYPVQSSYTITHHTLKRRLRKGHLKPHQ